MAEKRSKQRETDRQHYAQLGQDLRIHQSRSQGTPEASVWESERVVDVSPSSTSPELAKSEKILLPIRSITFQYSEFQAAGKN